MAGGLAVTLLALFWPGLPQGPAGVAARLSAWLTCDLAAAAWLAIAVARLARHRFFSDDDIDGSLGAGTARAAILQSLVQNTLEQTLLAVVAYGAWLLSAAPVGAAWAAVGCFSAGRLLFFLGYERGAPARALGFALTFYPTVGLLFASAIRLLAPHPGLA
jgi:MAPEG family